MQIDALMIGRLIEGCLVTVGFLTLFNLAVSFSIYRAMARLRLGRKTLEAAILETQQLRGIAIAAAARSPL